MEAQGWLSLLSTALTVLLATGAVYVGVRRWVQRAAMDAQATRRQLEPAEAGTTVAAMVEQAVRELPQIREAVATLTTRSDSNRDLAMSALTLARSAHERLDAHLAGHKET